MTLLMAGLALFLGVHLLPTVPAARNGLVAAWGEQRYKGAFSLAAALGLVLIVIGYRHADPAIRVFAPLPEARAIAPLAMTVSFVLLAAANMRTHIRRTVRHPMLLGVLIWSTVHLLANGDRRGTLLFGAFIAYAVIDLASAVHRGAVRPFVPQLRHDVIAIAAGILAALVVMTVHRVAFGVPVVAFGI